MTKGELAYAELVEIAYQLWTFRNFTNDLHVHDRNTLARHGWDHFIWAVRPTGTELICIENNVPFSVITLRTVASFHKHNHRVFWGMFDNGSVRVKELKPEEFGQIYDPESRVRLWAAIKDRPQFLDDPDDKYVVVRKHDGEVLGAHGPFTKEEADRYTKDEHDRTGVITFKIVKLIR